VRLLDHNRRLREAVPEAHASWSRAENIHLTLKFFGNVEKDRVETVSEAADRVVRQFSPFQISVTGNGAFPPHGNPRVLWIGVKDPSGQLTNLQQQFESECQKEGFKKEERPFRPHLTLARLRKPIHSRTLASIHNEMEFDEVDVAVTELLLIRSELRSEGSKYTTISRHSLDPL
jgi:2'-5' RNA ligase